MSQLLLRGFQITEKNRIKRMIADGDDWQIYLTNLDVYVLAVKPVLYERWVSDYSLPTGIFLDDIFPGCRIFLSSGNYIICSMDKGPYPEDNGQVEAFSIAFKTAIDIYSDADFHDAVYIEEYSLLLPASFDHMKTDNRMVYGRWLTGGINVSIDSLKLVSKIMSWLPKDELVRAIRLAGFEVSEEYDEQPEDKKDDNTKEIIRIEYENPKLEPKFGITAGERFVLIGRPELERFFNENIIDIVLHQEQYKRMGISFPGATILYGPPGSGKTYAVERLSEYLGWKRFDIDSSTIASSYIHDTSKKISEVFKSAVMAAPSIIVIDEMEAFLSNRSLSVFSGLHHIEEVAEFLRRIPEAVSKGVLVFAMTNMIDSIDPAILRRGRFDYIIEVKMAGAEEIEALLKFHFKELPIHKTVDANSIAKELAGHPMSDVTFVLREAGRFAVKKNLELIDTECFNLALGLLPKKTEQAKIGF